MTTNDLVGLSVIAFVLIAAALEWMTGRSANGARTARDWKIAGLTTFFMVAVQRPLVLLIIATSLAFLFPGSAGALSWLDQNYFWPTVVAFFVLEELLHGGGHYFAHSRRPKWRWAQTVQAFYKLSHRPHHISGDDDRGQISVTQTFTNGWLWWFIMPNYWFQLLGLYLGLTEVFLWATVAKALWAAHTHCNWNYDLYFHNHRWAWVRKTMWGLAHVITFPTQHHPRMWRAPFFDKQGKRVGPVLTMYDVDQIQLGHTTKEEVLSLVNESDREKFMDAFIGAVGEPPERAWGYRRTKHY